MVGGLNTSTWKGAVEHGTYLRWRRSTLKREEPMLTDAQVAALCDIAQSVALAGERRHEIERLMQEGYIARDDGHYRLTPKAEKALSDRGVGLNEA
jgi:hypothetical protein